MTAGFLRYFEMLMIDPTEEISPAMVISETLSKFCLQPLQHIGKEMAKLITNFYGRFLDSLLMVYCTAEDKRCINCLGLICIDMQVTVPVYLKTRKMN